VQRRVPILIGGSGREVTLRLVARFAGACNVGGPAEHLAEKEATLVAHCAEVGRDEREIERTAAMGTPCIRDTSAKAHAVLEGIFAQHGGAVAWQGMPVGTVDDVVAFCEPFVRQGYRHLVFGFPSPYDDETMTRLATEVRPRLEALIDASREGATDA
jgi:alkanesulfonate monooxygenase SsuD/methylene tetrahydromethanopterin reductase-like flavin-dependent oxidoreductase (luciferase family)